MTTIRSKLLIIIMALPFAIGCPPSLQPAASPQSEAAP